MTKIDDLLDVLANDPLPARLDNIDGEVMARLDRRLESRATRRSLVVAGVIAAVIGGGGGLVSRPSALAAQPLFAIPVQAPSNLLGR
jgi:hypothetical protein